MNVSPEQLVLGSILIDPWKAFAKVREIIEPDDFADDACRAVWLGALAAAKQGMPPDPEITTRFIVKQVPQADRQRALAVLVDTMAKSTPLAIHAEYYARLVVEKRIERDAAEVSQILARGPEDDELDQALRRLNKNRDRLELLRDNQQQATTGLLQDLVVDWLERLTSETNKEGIPTASRELDKHIGGPLPLGAYVILGAAPSNGKTLFMLQMLYAAAKAGHKCILYSQEMAADAICERVVATITGHSRKHIGKWNRADIAKEVLTWFDCGGQVIFRRCDSRVGSIIADMKWQAKHGATVFAIDYLGMLKAPGHKSGYDEVSACTNELKAATTQLNVTTIVGCQLNKEAMKEKPPIPQRHHLKDSSAMFENADAVLFLRYPKTDTELDKLQAGLKDSSIDCDAEEYFEVYVRKLRNRELPSKPCRLRLTKNPLRLTRIKGRNPNRSEELDDFNSDDNDTSDDGEF